MQEQGAGCLDGITEEEVLSFFVSEDGTLVKSCSYKKNIAAVFKAGLRWKEPQCRRILAFLPMLRETRKNIQYLTDHEIQILDYLTKERPDSNDCHLFLSETRPFSPLGSLSIGSIVTKVFRKAGIRQSSGDRKGTHIFA